MGTLRVCRTEVQLAVEDGKLALLETGFVRSEQSVCQRGGTLGGTGLLTGVESLTPDRRSQFVGELVPSYSKSSFPSTSSWALK